MIPPHDLEINDLIKPKAPKVKKNGFKGDIKIHNSMHEYEDILHNTIYFLKYLVIFFVAIYILLISALVHVTVDPS